MTHNRLMRVLTISILASLCAVAAGFFMPERWGLLGVVGCGLMFLATVMLGLVQLRQERR